MGISPCRVSELVPSEKVMYVPTCRQYRRYRQPFVLRGGGHIAFNGQMREEGFHFHAAHVLRVALVMKEDKAPDPVHVGPYASLRSVRME